MGHVPSKEFCAEPFAMDVLNQKCPKERLVAIALTKYYFPSVDDPLFQKLCQLRNENHVRNWYWRPTGVPMDVLPDAPTDAQLYQYYVEDATAVVDMNLPPNNFIPLPVMIVKMNDFNSLEHPTATNCVVVCGCGGSRNFEIITEDTEEDGSGKKKKTVRIEPNRGLTQHFLSSSFYNEVKAVNCFRLVAACYKHFCTKAGLTAAPWPLGTGLETHPGNLPLFLLIHQLNWISHGQEAWDDDGLVCVEKNGRVFLGLEGVTIATGAEGLAKSVEIIPPRRNSGSASKSNTTRGAAAARKQQQLFCGHQIRGTVSGDQVVVNEAESVTSPPFTQKLAHLEIIVERAKLLWKEANRAVTVLQATARKKKVVAAGGGGAVVPPMNGLSFSSVSDAHTSSSQASTRPGTPDACGSSRVAPAPPTGQSVGPWSADRMPLEARVIHSGGSLTCVLSFDAPAAHAAINQPLPPVFGFDLRKPTARSVSSNSVFPSHSPRGPEGAEREAVSTVNGEAGSEIAVVDLRVFLGDRTPVTIRTATEQWLPKYWRNPLQHLTRSSWQPHIEHGFVCYQTTHSALMVYSYDAWYPEVLLGCSPYIFLTVGESIFTLDEDGEYVMEEAA